MWQRFFRSHRSPAPDCPAVWRLQSLFNNFRRILDQNNTALELMAAMERSLGGEYIFDRTFIEESVRQLSSCVHHVAYNLNALTGNAHVALYDRFQEIRAKLDQILAGDPGTDAAPAVVPFSDVGWEMEPVVGLQTVCLAELRRHSRAAVADGFVVTTAGSRALLGDMTANGVDRPAGRRRAEVLEAMREATHALVPGSGGEALTVTVLVLGETDQAPVPAQEGVPAGEVVPTVIRVLTEAAVPASGKGLPGPPLVVLVQEAVPGVLSGTVHTRQAAGQRPDRLRITARLPQAPDSEDLYQLHRAHPFDIVASEVAARPFDFRLPDGRQPHHAVGANLLRGSALLTPEPVRMLAEMALALERMLGAPCVMHWDMPADGTCVVRRVSPLYGLAGEEPSPDLTEALEQAAVRCRGGQTVQSGVAAGRVVHVAEGLPPETFPAGAIAVARTASPRLAPLLLRAGGVLTEIGTAAGHLATVARELRVPAVFGIPDLLRQVPPDMNVTVDAGETVVYEGILEPLLRYGAARADLYPTDPEYRLLRRLLRFIQPLRLVDPESSDFSPRGCRSFHDIIHFCHEQAVNELVNLHRHRPGSSGLHTRRLSIEAPIQISVLDIGGGIAADAGPAPGMSDIRSEPLVAFLEGLRRPEALGSTPPALRLRDILSGMPRSLAALNAPADSMRGNLAIAGRDYLNLSLRLGYHFSVVDAYLGADLQRSHIYFRFVGGLAEAELRVRRANFIRDVLASLDFSVSQKGDLVVGRLKLVAAECLRSALIALGALTTFTRQLDTAMRTDRHQQELFRVFAEVFLRIDPSQPGDG
jgi:pyruvate,water dikinase